MHPFTVAAALPLFVPSYMGQPGDTAVENSALGELAFAHDVVLTRRPQLLVRWGRAFPTHLYLACYQAVLQNNLRCSCYALSENTATSKEDVPHHGNLSHWIQAPKEEAQLQFADSTIDLLLLEDLGSYEDAKAVFDAWIPKLRPDAIVLLPDVMVRSQDCGVWRVWEESINEYPHSVALMEGRGLGAFSPGQQAEEKPALLQWSDEFLRRYYSFYGAYLVNLLFPRKGMMPEAMYQVALRELQTAQAERMMTVHELKEAVEERNAARRELYQIENDLQAQKAHSAQLDIDVANWKSMVGYEQKIREQILGSLSWRLTAPLRFGIARLRQMMGRSGPQ